MRKLVFCFCLSLKFVLMRPVDVQCQNNSLINSDLERGGFIGWSTRYSSNYKTINLSNHFTRNAKSAYSIKFWIDDLKGCNYPEECKISNKNCEVKNSCRHLEISLNSEASKTTEGTTTTYKWSTYFDKLPSNNVKFIHAQFHTKPSGASPVIQIQLLGDKTIELAYKTFLYDSLGTRILAKDTKSFKRFLLDKNVISKFGAISLHSWYDFELQIKWSHWNSEKNDGFINLKVSESNSNYEWECRQDSVATMNSYNQYFNIGAYWGGKAISETIFYIDNISVE